jgi:hypothetical protein
MAGIDRGAHSPQIPGAPAAFLESADGSGGLFMPGPRAALLPPRADAVIGFMIFRRILAWLRTKRHIARPVRGGPGSIVAPAAADGGLDLGEFARLLNSGKIEDLRKIAETMTKNPPGSTDPAGGSNPHTGGLPKSRPGAILTFTLLGDLDHRNGIEVLSTRRPRERLPLS